MKTQPNSHRAQAGITLVETTVAGSVLAVLTGLAVPGFDNALQRRHLEGAAAQLETDIHYTRALAVARNAPLRISFDSSNGGGCYVIHTGSANECSCSSDGSPVCQGAAQAERGVRFAAADAVRLQANVRSVLFDPVRGTSTPAATVRLSTRSGAAIHQVVNIMGRVRSCSPAPAMSGYKAC